MTLILSEQIIMLVILSEQIIMLVILSESAAADESKDLRLPLREKTTNLNQTYQRTIPSPLASRFPHLLQSLLPFRPPTAPSPSNLSAMKSATAAAALCTLAATSWFMVMETQPPA
jgi:hypothetical protein